MWEEVTTRRSGAVVHRGVGVYRKLTPDAELEAATLSWLRSQGLPTAEVLDVGPGWLLTRAVLGRTAADPWPQDRRVRVVDALADSSQALHSITMADCPFDRTLSVTVPLARVAAASEQVDLDDLDDERRGWSTLDLLRDLDERLPRVRPPRSTL